MTSFDPHFGVICYNKDQGRIVCEYYLRNYKCNIDPFLWEGLLDNYLDCYDKEKMPVVEYITPDNSLSANNSKEFINRAILFEKFTLYINDFLDIYDFL